jgi:transposase-like protein
MPQQGRRSADDLLMLALACGATLENAARQAGISESTVRRRIKDPEFQRKITALRWDMVQRAVGMVTAAMAESVKTLVVLQKETVPSSSRLGAARTMLEIGLKLREQNDLEQRLAALEEQVTATSADR